MVFWESLKETKSQSDRFGRFGWFGPFLGGLFYVFFCFVFCVCFFCKLFVFWFVVFVGDLGLLCFLVLFVWDLEETKVGFWGFGFFWSAFGLGFGFGLGFWSVFGVGLFGLLHLFSEFGFALVVFCFFVGLFFAFVGGLGLLFGVCVCVRVSLFLCSLRFCLFDTPDVCVLVSLLFE